MKTKIFIILIFLTGSNVFPQGGWMKITDPSNAVTQYTTFFPYVGASFIDLNNDNLIDLFASPRILFMNSGNGRYSLSAPLSYNPLTATSGSSWADLDNDGDIDCALAGTPSRVFLNNGAGAFSNATSFFPGLVNHGAWGCAIGDYNENKKLDLIFVHAEGFHPPLPPEACRFYFQSDSSFNFQQITGYPFNQYLSSYTNPFWSDYDLDGDMDLFIASGPVDGIGAVDPCYKNMKKEWGTDTLVKMTTELFALQIQDGQCYNFIDHDNDGDLDLCLTNYYSAPTRFYRNNGGTYVNVATPFTTATTNIANCWGDYDNDGDLDVIITNDNAVTNYYRNDGGSFIYLSNGLTTPTATNGAVNCDYDNDGDLDVFFNGVGNNGNTSSVGLYKNESVAGNNKWVNIKLRGTASNNSAIGAIVRLKCLISGNPVWQMREVNAQNSFQGQNDLRVHFGLKDASVIDSIIIRWPDESREVFTNTVPDRFYDATQGQGLSEIVFAGISQLSSQIPDKFILFQNYPNPFNPETKIKFSIPDVSEGISAFAKMVIYNSSGKEIETLVNGMMTPGTYEVRWNASGFPSGVYFCRLSHGNIFQTRKMLVVK